MLKSDSMLEEARLNPAFPKSSSPVEGRTFVGRVRQIASLESALGPGLWQGAVVVGQGGTGKTALVQELLAEMPPDATTHYLRGTTLASATPYGILGLLLGRARSKTQSGYTLAEVLHTLGGNWAAAANGSRPVVVVDNAESADRWSAMALSELVRKRSIRLILVCRRINGIAPEFSRLWRTGQLKRVNVPPLSAGDARELIAHVLSGPCSLAAANVLWRQSEGNPLYLKALVREAVKVKALTHVDQVWIWDAKQGHDLASLAIGQVERLMNANHGNKEVLELVAVAGSFSVATLTTFVSQNQVDDLLEREDLSYVDGSKSAVAVAHPVLASVLPHLVSTDQNRHWLGVAEDREPLAKLVGRARQDRKRWFRACGVAEPSSPVSCARSTPGLAPEISLAAGAVGHVVGETRPAGVGLAHEGIVNCSPLQANRVANYAEGLAMAGSQDGAMAVARALAERLRLIPRGSSAEQQDAVLPVGIASPLLRIFIVCGEWRMLEELLVACSHRGLDGGVQECIQFEVGSGLAQAYQGNHIMALQALNQATAQIQQCDMAGWGEMARVGLLRSAIYLRPPRPGTVDGCRAAMADEAENLGELMETITTTSGLPPLLATLASCMAIDVLPTELSSPGQSRFTCDLVLSLSQGTDLPVQRMMTLAARVDGQTAFLCDELLMIASAQEGSLADVLGTYAKGLVAHDSNVLIQSVERASNMNFPGLSLRAAQWALDFAPLVNMRSIRRQLQRLVRLPADLFEQAHELNAVLTEREESVGLLAAKGSSNKEIAQIMGVSVRTVEGHLYQVYAKLQVSSRVELLPLLRQDS